jgi:hypothetical protein
MFHGGNRMVGQSSCSCDFYCGFGILVVGNVRPLGSCGGICSCRGLFVIFRRTVRGQVDDSVWKNVVTWDLPVAGEEKQS